uniref:Uncharacterized protein n=1 Tax=Arundo donax TaxID=35708 RepID=A0A0A9HCM2_ARUDO
MQEPAASSSRLPGCSHSSPCSRRPRPGRDRSLASSSFLKAGSLLLGMLWSLLIAVLLEWRPT